LIIGITASLKGEKDNYCKDIEAIKDIEVAVRVLANKILAIIVEAIVATLTMEEDAYRGRNILFIKRKDAGR
jgi:hypothetical protein